MVHLLKKITKFHANNDKRIQLIDLIKTYAYWTNKDLVCKKEELIVTI